MNKKRVDIMIPYAYDALKEIEICEKDKKNEKTLVIDSTYRGYISSFGAAVSMGSLISAVAFFTVIPAENKKSTTPDRGKISEGIFKTLKKHQPAIQEKSLFEYVKNHGDTKSTVESVLDAAIALKLAMNLYPTKQKE